MKRIFEIHYDKQVLANAHCRKHPDYARLPPLPADLDRMIIHRSTIIERSSGLPPPRVWGMEYYDVYGRLIPTQYTTTLTAEPDGCQIDVCIRPVASDQQISQLLARREMGLDRRVAILGERLGFNQHSALPARLRELTHWYQRYLLDPAEYERKKHRGDVFKRWTYQVPTGLSDYNARASSRLPKLAEPLHHLAQDLMVSARHFQTLFGSQCTRFPPDWENRMPPSMNTLRIEYSSPVRLRRAQRPAGE